MYPYYTDLVWKINFVLAAAALFLTAVIIAYAAIIGYSARRRAGRLLRIKKNVYNLLIPDGAAVPDKRTLTHITPRDFLDVEINRERGVIFFNDAEQDLLKKHFAKSKNIAAIKRSAKYSINKWRRIEAILSLGYAECASALDILARSIKSSDRDTAYFSIIALGQIKTVESARILLNFLKMNTFGRHKIVSLLKDFPVEIAADAFTLSDDPDPGLRVSSLEIIRGLKPQGYLSKAKALLADKSDDVRAAACECLGNFSKEATGPLLACLKDRFWLVRMNAVSALSAICGADCIPEIIPLLNDDSWSVIESVKKVMTENVEAALPYIKKFLHGEDPVAKKASAEALVNSGYIINILKNILSGTNDKRAEAIHLLKGLIKSNVHSVLESALEPFEDASRSKILEIVRETDMSLAEHIQKKLEKEINE